jgi:hypothetical protein
MPAKVFDDDDDADLSINLDSDELRSRVDDVVSRYV